MEQVKLKIQYQDDREKLISALANSGYKVWVEEVDDLIANTIYYVVFELKYEKNRSV